MRYAVIATIITIALTVMLAVTFLSFMTSYNNDSASIRDIIGNGMLFLSFLISSCIIVQIFFVWVFSNQVEKLKSILDTKNKEISALRGEVKRVKEDVDLLL
jgi:hypothetical protein